MTATSRPFDVDTPAGIARVHLSATDGKALLCLGHGAGGGVTAGDLVQLATAASAGGWLVALVEQPYRVAGRRAPDRAEKLDRAWIAVVAELRRRFSGLVLATGGRSSGARVACRTATATGSRAVVCLAFPLQPPGRPERSRASELALPGGPILIVQGERDPFGGPHDLPAGPVVIAVPGDHSLRGLGAPVAERVVGWLDQLLE
jgi:predicted alpha/beta-hydrolase family hydrolase